MANQTTPHTEPRKNTDPAEEGIDPDQLNEDGTPGSDAVMLDDLDTAQTAGSRNERVTEYNGNKHSVESATTGSEPGAYAPDSKGGAEGISSHSLSDELTQQRRVGSSTKPPASEDDAMQYPEGKPEGDLPHGLAERVETVEISTMRPDTPKK